MRNSRFMFVVALSMLCAVALADDKTWNGAADSVEWYAFNAVGGTFDPVVWVNNWDEEIWQFPGQDPPEHGSWDWPGGTDTANISMSGPELWSRSASVSSLNIGLGGTIVLMEQIQCTTLNTAGIVYMDRVGRIYECAIQDDGGTGVLRSQKWWNFATPTPTLEATIISCPVEIPDTMALGLLRVNQLNNVIELLGDTETTKLVIDGDATLTGAGWVETTDNQNNQICGHFNNGQRFTNQTTIHAAGHVGCTNIGITNEGSILADRGGRLTVDPHDSPTDGNPAMENSGTMRATGGSTLTLNGGFCDNTGGLIEAETGSTVELHDWFSVAGGTLRTTGTGVMRSTTGFVPPALRDLTFEGRFEAAPAGVHLTLGGTLVNDGVIEAQGEVRPWDELVLAGSGELNLHNGGQLGHDPTSATNGPNHTIRASGATNNHIVRHLMNQGSVVVEPGATLVLQRACEAHAGSITVVDGTLQPVAGLTISGQLAGAGTVNGAFTLADSGILAPGASTGTLTTGSLTISDGAGYQWQYSSSTGSDLVDVNGTLDMGSAVLAVSIEELQGEVPSRVVLFEYNSLASTPGVWQFRLSEGFDFTGVDTANNELALTGVEDIGLLFKDSFETGNLDAWSSAHGEAVESMPIASSISELQLVLNQDQWRVAGAGQTLIVDGRDAQGTSVAALVSRDGALRAGLHGADGWYWTGWFVPVGPQLELVWRPGEVSVFDDRGLVNLIEGVEDSRLLDTVRVRR